MRRALPLIALATLAGGPAAGVRPDGGGSAAPPAAVHGGTAQAEPVRFELGNGLRVWVQEDSRRPVVVVEIVYKVGSLNEGPGTTGLAHYVEHMVYRATENIPSEDGYRFIDRIGGRWSGGTWPMGTMYREIVPSWALEDALHLTAERMARSLFDETEFERERSNVVTEANGFARTTPEAAFRDALMATSFEVHPYRNSSNTWARDNLTVTRDEAYDFYRHYYGPDNAVLAVVGDVSVDEVRRLVEKHFGGLAPAPRSGEVTLVEPPQRVEKRVTLTHPDVEPRIEILYRSPQAAHPDFPVLPVLDEVLSARLEAAVAAAGGGEVSTNHAIRPYPFVYRISVDLGAGVDLEGMVNVVQGEVERLRREGVAEPELRAAREAADGERPGDDRGEAESCREADRPPSLLEIVADLISREVLPWEVGPELEDRIRRAQRTVTSADVQAYADRWLRASQRTVGFLVPGPDDFVPDWSDDRPLAGDRMEIPGLTVAPEARGRPRPVPQEALEPLAPLAIETGRRELNNGAVVWAARRDGTTAALHARIRFPAADPPGKEGLSLLAARLLAGDPALTAVGEELEVTTSDAVAIANQGDFDIRLCFPAAHTAAAVEALARALRVPSSPAERLEAERERLLEEIRAAGGETAAETARRRVLESAAPGWRLTPPGTTESVARVSAADVDGFLERHVHGGALALSLVGPDAPAVLLDGATAAFGRVRPGGPVDPAPRPAAGAADASPSAAPAEEWIPVDPAIQVDILAGLPGVPRGHPDRLALQLLNYIVGVPFYGGRLGWALTSSGLTYSSSAVTTSGVATGHVLLGTRANTNNAAAAVHAIREVVAQVGEQGVADWEIREAKAFTLGRAVLYGPGPDSDAPTLAAALLDAETLGDEVLDPPALSRTVLGVTPEQVDAAARRYYRPERLRLVAVGAVPTEPPESPFPPGTFRALFEEPRAARTPDADRAP